MTLTRWPVIEQNEINLVLEVLKNGILVKGPFRRELQDAFGHYVGVPFCLAVSSCTHALHAALRAIGVGNHDEVLVPNLTYCGSVSPILVSGATPVFVDVNETDFNLSLDDAAGKRTNRTKAIIVVHLHGYPCDINAVRNALPGLMVIEDACQAHGAKRGTEFAGSWGDVACFSLNQVKPLCGGQGGLITSKDPNIWSAICDYCSPGQHSTVGLNYEITEVSAAIAFSQLAKLESILGKANSNFQTFRSAIEPKGPVRIQECETDVRPTWHKVRLQVPEGSLQRYLEALQRRKIPYETWPNTLVSQRSEYSVYRALTPVAEKIMQTSFILGNEEYPFHAQDEEIVIQWATAVNEIGIELESELEDTMRK